MKFDPPVKRSSSRSAFFAPGVGLFRRFRFATKALIISGAFMIPIAVLAWSYWSTKSEAMSGTQLEINGADYLIELTPILRQARKLREASVREVVDLKGGSTDASADGIRKALLALKARNSLYGDDVAKAWAAAESGLANLPPAADGLFKVYAGYNKELDALANLRRTVLDESGLLLDPEAPTFFMMDAVFRDLPDLLESLSRQVLLAAATSATGQGGDFAKQELARVDVLAEEHAGDLFAKLGRVGAERPDLTGVVATKDLPQRLAKLRDLTTDSIGEGGKDQALKFLEQSDSVQTDMKKLADSTRQSFKALLNERAASLNTSVIVTSVVVGTSLALAGYLFISFALVMASGMKAVVKQVNFVAQGDLAHTPNIRGRDEMAVVMRRMGEMQTMLSATLGQVNLNP